MHTVTKQTKSNLKLNFPNATSWWRQTIWPIQHLSDYFVTLVNIPNILKFDIFLKFHLLSILFNLMKMVYLTIFLHISKKLC